MKEISSRSIATVRGVRNAPADDFWRDVPSTLVLADWLPDDAWLGLEDFSHLEVVYHFHLVDPARVETGSRHPRGREDWPRVGIFAQRAKSRPNRLGVSRCRVVGRRGRELDVLDLDAIDGTPVLDLKPWLREFAPLDATTQAAWATELMTGYYAPWADAPEGLGQKG